MSNAMPSGAIARIASALRRYCLILLGSIIILVAFGIKIFDGSESCDYPYRADRQSLIGGQVIKLEMVSKPAQLEQGLSGRPCLPLDQGMLFVFDKAGTYPFWMKDMAFNLDIIWLDNQKKVTDIKAGLEPATYPQTFSNSQPASYVIELAAGQAAKLGIEAGSQLFF